MKFGRFNIITGGIAIFLGIIGGFVLGFTMEPFFEKGFYAVTLSRELIRAGHTHGMPFAFYNILVGSLLDRLALDDKWKKRCSFFTICSLIMPIGLILRGVTDGATTFVPVVLVGSLSFFCSVAIVIKGALSPSRQAANHVVNLLQQQVTRFSLASIVQQPRTAPYNRTCSLRSYRILFPSGS